MEKMWFSLNSEPDAMAIDRRVQRTRTALYDALVELIREGSYDAIRVDDILRRANVGRSTFYDHFRSKDELLERSLERLRAELLAIADAEGRRDLWSVSDQLFAHVHQYRDIHVALSHSSGGPILSRAISRNFTQVVRILLPASPRRQLPRELTTLAVSGLVEAVMHWWLDRNPAVPPETAARLFRRLLSHGLAADWPELTNSGHWEDNLR